MTLHTAYKSGQFMKRKSQNCEFGQFYGSQVYTENNKAYTYLVISHFIPDGHTRLKHIKVGLEPLDVVADDWMVDLRGLKGFKKYYYKILNYFA